MVDAPDTCELAMITAYYDDSGSYGDTKALVVCGFVSSIDQWLLFERDWRVVLKMPQFDLEHLHMKDLRSHPKFKDNLPLQRDLFERLQNILRVRTTRTFAGSILLDDYDRVNTDYRVSEDLGPPAVVAAEMAIVKMMTWRKRKCGDQPISIVVDQGILHFGLLSDRVYKRYGLRIVPAKVSDTPPLQGSDMAAWEIHRVLSDLATGKLTQAKQLRGSFRALLEKLNIAGDNDDDYDNASWFVLDEPEMRRVFDKHNFPKRIRS